MRQSGWRLTALGLSRTHGANGRRADFTVGVTCTTPGERQSRPSPPEPPAAGRHSAPTPRQCFLPALAFLLCASPGLAQNRSVFVTVGGGVTVPMSSVRANFGTGWNLSLGFVFPVTRTLGLQLDVVHARVSDRTTKVDTADTPIRADQIPVTASHFMDAGTASIRLTPYGQRGRLRVYALAGGGVYYRKVTLASPGAGLVSVCNPWWFVCRPKAVAVSEIAGRRNAVGLGLSAGVGVSCALGPDVSLYLEARLHDILTAPTYTKANGAAERATALYLPISAGIRF
jgi:hypothetical protein